MSHVLAADIGGTKTLFQLTMGNDDVIFDKHCTIERACFAVAGPVSGHDANVTNLPWQLNADDLATHFNIKHVHLCNDFEAVAHGIACLTEDEIVTLQQGDVDETMPRAVIGAGTGLGQALLFPIENGWRVVSTEGGHTDFAPSDNKQILLLEHLIKRFGHVSYERVVSGVGLVTIYQFLRAYEQYDENPQLRQLMMAGDPAAAISKFANDHHDALASEALNLFIQIYGSQAGNLALTVSPRGGLYLAGGIAAKNIERFIQGQFINAFVAKGRMQPLMEKIPVHLITQPRVGLLGARLLAQKIIV